LRTLDRLNLDRNQLSNIQAGAFFGLENLRYLNFSSNRLDSNVISDGGFYGLDALEVLDLSNNNLNNLPDQVHTYLSQLTTLFLNGNQIQQLAGIKLNLPNLQFLSLASNGLSLIQVGVLNNLTSLIKL
jgi:Leucine-rich repeat (LRR) protein